MRYITGEDVTRILNRPDLTDHQRVEASLAASDAEDWIDQYTGRVWQSSQIAAERHILRDGEPVIILSRRPIISVQSVVLSNLTGTANYSALSTDYSVDLDRGRVYFAAFSWAWAWSYDVAAVTYTPQSTPGAIRRAARLLALHWMQPILDPESFGVTRYEVGEDERVEFRDRDIPDEVISILAPYKRKYIA